MDFLTSLFGFTCRFCETRINQQQAVQSRSTCTACLHELQVLEGQSIPAPDLLSDLSGQTSDHLPDGLPDHLPETLYGGLPLRSTCLYEGWVKTFVLKQKQNPLNPYTKLMALRLLKACPPEWQKRLVIGVPARRLGPIHLVEILTHELKQSGLTVALKNPLRRRLWAGKPQKELSEKLRRAPGAGRFRFTRQTCDERETLQAKSILLIDDVATTGATLRECQRALAQLGCTDVTALVFAVTPRKYDLKNKKGVFSGTMPTLNTPFS